ncbi:DUF1517 domain-containing protein [Trichocoleus sp. FACHB-591]|uniref:DUF1517 domain-containing protein n=1 Tax=Trichocoleus sp. FACHB-591 TaxID=2692872 RepID=UPI001687B0A4|nr:DUF1517 domain-containing protein [Trichocoleus sp. FACHB-591]MBD2095167.1 DUF1517 domain-containing protein [Trichocoleus sp. FACHB-591]
MRNKLFSVIKPFLKSVLLVGLVLTLALSNADGALAARSGGRIGGGSFRAPSRGPTYSAPRSYTPGPGGYGGGYGYGYGGGGGFSPLFFIPFLGGTGGLSGLFGILIFFAIANFLVSTFRRVGAGTDGESLDYDASSSNPAVSVAKLQVGLLAEARTLQADLNRIAEAADTSSSEGLVQVLQEASLALLRHPEYWIYAGSESQQTRLSAAEAQFNRLALAERSKFGEETLTNFNTRRQLKSANDASALTVAEPGGALTNTSQAPSEYIVVTILVGTQGKWQFPAINNTEDLRRALSQIGAIPSEQLLAVEILWTPQAEDDTLTTDDMIAEYPNLKLV